MYTCRPRYYCKIISRRAVFPLGVCLGDLGEELKNFQSEYKSVVLTRGCEFDAIEKVWRVKVQSIGANEQFETIGYSDPKWEKNPEDLIEMYSMNDSTFSTRIYSCKFLSKFLREREKWKGIFARNDDENTAT